MVPHPRQFRLRPTHLPNLKEVPRASEGVLSAISIFLRLGGGSSMLRDAGVRTKLLAVLAIPTLLLVVVTSLLVGGQVTAARRAGQVNALTDVAIQVNRVVHSAPGGAQRDPRLPAGPQLRRRGPDDRASGSSPTSSCASLRQLVADSPVAQMSDAVQAAVARSAAASRRARQRPEVRRRRPLLRHRDRRLLHQGHPHRPRPARASSPRPAPPPWPSACRRTRRSPPPSSTPRTSATSSRSALLRGTLTEADFAQAAALVAQQRQAHAGLPAQRRRQRRTRASTTRSPPRRTTRSTRCAATFPTCSRAATRTSAARSSGSAPRTRGSVR